MVKVQAPALSLEASGSLGGALVFSNWKGRAYVRTLVKPSNPRTPLQIGIRAALKFLAQNWDPYGLAEIASWQPLADNANVSPFNSYVKDNMQSWRNGYGVTQMYPASREITPTTINTFSALAGPRHITITWSITDETDNWGVVLCRSTTNGFTPSWANAIALMLAVDTGEHQYVDAPLDAGGHYYRMAALTRDGVIGTYKAQITAIVP